MMDVLGYYGIAPLLAELVALFCLLAFIIRALFAEIHGEKEMIDRA